MNGEKHFSWMGTIPGKTKGGGTKEKARRVNKETRVFSEERGKKQGQSGQSGIRFVQDENRQRSRGRRLACVRTEKGQT